MRKYIFLLTVATLSAGAARGDSFTTITVPGAINTELFGISNNGVAVGVYYDSSNLQHGLEVLADGTLVYPFDAPGSALYGTLFNGINNSGTIWGQSHQPFILSAGVYTSPASGCGFTPMNDLGDTEGSCNGQAFLQKNGNPPVPIALWGPGFNNLDQIVGQEDLGGVYVGFVENSDGTSTPVALPGAYLSSLFSINDQGVFVGFTVYTGGASQQYFYGTLGNLIPFSLPGEAGAAVNGINDSDQVVGSYADSNGLVHGFISSVSVPTPEPSSMLLGLAGLSLLVVFKSFRRRSQL